MDLSQSPVSFLHLPREIRNMVYDFTFIPDQQYINILDCEGTVYTKKIAPLLYVHPTIADDLRHRLYQHNISLVLPIQNPSKLAVRRDLQLDALQTCLGKMSKLMKRQCERLIVEASQIDLTEDEDAMDVDGDTGQEYDDGFAKRLVPMIMLIKKEIPSLNDVKFIFWFGSWSLDPWTEHLERLAVEWKRLEHADAGENDQDIHDTNQDQQFTNAQSEIGDEEDKINNPVQEIAFDVFDDTLDPLFNESNIPSLWLNIQFNLFDYHDPDAGDGGFNWIQGWDIFADRTQKWRTTLQVRFSAMDLRWKDHISGHYEGREFEPKGWSNPYVNTMYGWEQDDVLYKYGSLTETCKPLFVTTCAGSRYL
ncbi:hypothetical protein FZEAL_343 [Fusarium zealandicum]|uniref:Uncharacterized protein n=1 Tax=Fusarium zealandicum TaxID=1053134 RepID=A0A8H4UV15_9HYPO|nr:hypothetical protein FZEAL_343 [Fusarium zealandicum]